MYHLILSYLVQCNPLLLLDPNELVYDLVYDATKNQRIHQHQSNHPFPLFDMQIMNFRNFLYQVMVLYPLYILHNYERHLIHLLILLIYHHDVQHVTKYHVLLCQLNRGLEQRENKRPRLSDLRDSGTIEQDADVVMFIYRDEYYNKDENNPERGIAEIDVSKQRMGPTGVVRLAYLNAYTRFENLAQDAWG